MTCGLDRIPVSQASPLELLRMLWRLWRGRRENPLVMAGYPWRPRRRLVRVMFWFAVILAWAVSLGVLPALEAAFGDQAFEAVSVALLIRKPLSPDFYLIGDAVRVHFVLSLLAALAAATLVLPAMAFRVPEGSEGLAELRLPPMTNREVAFGSVYWGLWAYVAVLFPFWLVQAYFVALAGLNAWRDPYPHGDTIAAGLLPALLPLLHGTALVGSVSAFWDRGGTWFVQARDALWQLVRGVALLLPWVLVVAVAREARYRFTDWPYVGGEDFAACTGTVFATATVHALALAWALAKRGLSFAGERFFAPLDPDGLARAWWLAADREAACATKWTAPEFSRRLLWIPAVAAVAVVVPLLIATTTSRDLGGYRVTPGYAFAGDEIEVLFRRHEGRSWVLVLGDPTGERTQIPLEASTSTGEGPLSARVVLPELLTYLALRNPRTQEFGSIIYPPGLQHTPHLGTPWEAVRARLVRLPVPFCLSVLLAVLLLPREARAPARRAGAWAMRAALPGVVPFAVLAAAHAAPFFSPATFATGGAPLGFALTRGFVLLVAPAAALWLCSTVAVLHVASARRRGGALAAWIAGACAILVAWNTVLPPSRSARFLWDAPEATALLVALVLFAVVPLSGGADGLRQRLHDEELSR